ncbi:STM3941 family protein [Psychroserpens ponticola]|uniref:Uncharacterized protein n=1 Tax=Psychroserpens ponticola TaxID=2932268 RepID=A0ABY7S2R9_9FLAO|nr:STM3941 family protein [Psychroserpens ponticola]WCO03577.1 hypothetical protein MUN68_008720 [Psychroserpens ponticola]
MNKEIKFKKNRILLGILFFSLMLFASIWFLANPELFLRNVFMKEKHIQTIGIIGVIYFSALLFSFFKILRKKYAIQITDDFLIDNSKYESLGKVKWRDITKIQRLKKRSIEVFVKRDIHKTRKRNLLSKFLAIMNNRNYKESIIISSALTDISIEDLFEGITSTYKTNK